MQADHGRKLTPRLEAAAVAFVHDYPAHIVLVENVFDARESAQRACAQIPLASQLGVHDAVTRRGDRAQVINDKVAAAVQLYRGGPQAWRPLQPQLSLMARHA